MNKKIDYDIWANELILEALEAFPENERRKEMTRLLGHVYKAQKVWYKRARGNKFDKNKSIWEDYTLEQCRKYHGKSRKRLEGIAIKSGTMIRYEDLQGNAFQNAASDILDHVIIHGQHHRAQIQMLLRKAGVTPPPLDYIYFLRKPID